MKENKNKLIPFGIEVKKALLKKGITQKEICKQLNMTESRFCEIIYGIRPGKKYQSRIMKALGIKDFT